MSWICDSHENIPAVRWSWTSTYLRVPKGYGPKHGYSRSLFYFVICGSVLLSSNTNEVILSWFSTTIKPREGHVDS
eukprot:557775-Amphidinium_carterae.1